MSSDDTTTTPEAERPQHDQRGRAAKGNNLRGEIKKKRTKGIARFLAQETDNGIEAARAIVEIMRDKGHRDRFKAADWVVVRLIGKAPDRMEVSGAEGKPLNPFEGWTPEALLALAKTKPEGEK